MDSQQAARARFQAAMEHHRQGRLEQAEGLYREAIGLAPNLAGAHHNLGMTLAERDRIEEAVEYFQYALKLDPQSADAARNLAQAQFYCRQYRPALEACQQLLHLDPQASQARMQIVALHELLGDTEAAQRALLEAAAAIAITDPSFAQLTAELEALTDKAITRGDTGQAWPLASSLCRCQPEHIPAIRMLSWCLRQAHPHQDDAQLDADLRFCLASRHLDHQPLTQPCLALLRIRYPELGVEGTDCDLFIKSPLGRDPLFIAWLGHCLNTDQGMERRLSQLRCRLLRKLMEPSAQDPRLVDLFVALALQCFANEYLYAYSAAEHSRIETLTAELFKISDGWQKLATADYPTLLVIGCYRAWHRLPEPQALQAALTHQAPAWIREPLRRLLSEPLAERAIIGRLHAGTIQDSTSKSVRQQYEQSPYPRWQCLEPEPADSVAGYLHYLFPHFKPPASLETVPRILIAGCGTGEHAIRVALRHPQAHITAIDLSLASLAYAQRQADALQVSNLELRHADILQLPQFEQAFEVIESVGVLHHMARPQDGLAALLKVLDLDGVIKLGLYSRTARRQVSLARQRIAQLGLNASPEDVRSLRARILDGQETELEPLLESPDFYSLSNCRDLLFHVQEHQYDLLAIEALLGEQRLEFIGFQFADNKVPQRYLEFHPNDTLPGQFVHWDNFEQRYPNTFAGMYQFWCHRH